MSPCLKDPLYPTMMILSRNYKASRNGHTDSPHDAVSVLESTHGRLGSILSHARDAARAERLACASLFRDLETVDYRGREGWRAVSHSRSRRRRYVTNGLRVTILPLFDWCRPCRILEELAYALKS
jgi:hypothetical protein